MVSISGGNYKMVSDSSSKGLEVHSRSKKKFLCLYGTLLVVGLIASGFMFVRCVFYQRLRPAYSLFPNPPPHEEVAKVARYVMHISDWASMSTFSTHHGIEGYPFVNVFSVADGPIHNATGVPYFYLTELELSVKDLDKDNRASITMSEAQSRYCDRNGFDPEDPRCAHVIFTGNIVKVPKSSTEERFARESLFSRHPEMPTWPKDHDWFFAKLDILHIYVLNYFGGAAEVTPEEYYLANPFE